MKTFAATVIALAASADAFAPMKGDARASTSLNSHFTSVETKLKNKDTLLKSLNDVGVKATVSVNGEQIEARGYKGKVLWRILSSPNLIITMLLSVTTETPTNW
uniref:Uncharacterized protein n=1 Tax=Thalassionema nitzschioides TaxID=33649 RepID=A0A7S1E2M5_9STRA|mmetsp:Transcript_3167/g.2635  ORF Transcript_3167/g.2635 Transcript_3167/m.2635 type:complete len:104 (+) Transcript_3167:30-341(+)